MTEQTCERCEHLASLLNEVLASDFNNMPPEWIERAEAAVPVASLKEKIVTCKLCGKQHGRDFCPTWSIELHR